MSWHFTAEAAGLPAAVRAYVDAEPARNTGVLTLLDGPPGIRGWWRAEGLVGGVCLLVGGSGSGGGGGMLVLGVMADAAARALPGALARALPERGHEVREARGEAGTVEAFAGPFAAATGREPRAVLSLRLFRLGTLTPPRPAPRGAARAAGPGDVPLLLDWMCAYARDVGEDPDADYSAQVEAMVGESRFLLWHEEDGAPVAMAGFSRPAAGQSRVSLVYTPPAHRARGYAGAVTAEASGAAAAAGAEQVLLFTDLANPTSNALYQRLGYRPIGDHTRVAFRRRSDPDTP
ncbi:GNAT family N-acetyltransferase [Streptomyces sp. NPDC048623]|uniref:GNAT family N-acetyltransferase n=1 Tax=Streptomyces sp. NPDC048623 TaxID=3155761 RepID=UPI00343D3A14